MFWHQFFSVADFLLLLLITSVSSTDNVFVENLQRLKSECGDVCETSASHFGTSVDNKYNYKVIEKDIDCDRMFSAELDTKFEGEVTEFERVPEDIRRVHT